MQEEVRAAFEMTVRGSHKIIPVLLPKLQMFRKRWKASRFWLNVRSWIAACCISNTSSTRWSGADRSKTDSSFDPGGAGVFAGASVAGPDRTDPQFVYLAERKSRCSAAA